MNSIIVGTAGHIDHGKTALIKALNGFEGDTLNEEKKRSITINLSFSHMSNGENNIAFIDVPGHEALVKTMISGAYAIDIAMLIVAANDGIMPQTKEHLQILDIFEIKSLVVVITKKDLIDAQTLQNRITEIQNFIKTYKNLEILEIFATSTKDENSISELRNYLFTLKPKKRSEGGIFRYYIDRAFFIKGAGLVVSGSLIEGDVKKGDKIYNYDTKNELIVRNIQIHDSFVDNATAPNRVALNLTSKNNAKILPSQMLSKKGFFRTFNEADGVITRGEILSNLQLIFCVGTKQLNAKVKIYDKFNDKTFVCFKFDRQIALKFGEIFVLLQNNRVVGGGKILNPIVEPIKKSQKIRLLEYLYNQNFLNAFEILKISHKHGFGLISSYQRFGLNHEKALEIARNLPNSFIDENELNIYDNAVFGEISAQILEIFSKNKFAIISATSIANKMSWTSQNLCLSVLEKLYADKKIEKNGSFFIDKNANFDEILQNLDEKIYQILQNGGFEPLAPYNIYDELEIDRINGDNALKKLTAAKKIVRLEHNVFIAASSLQKMVNLMRQMIKTDGFINVQTLKSKLNLSRKYAIAYLEYLDKFSDIKKSENDRIFG